MIKFKDIQSTLKELIAARFAALAEETESYADIAVTEHKGTQENEQECEDSLQQKGVSIAVCVPSEGDAANQGAGAVVMDTKIGVLLDINSERNDPAKNTDAANLDIYLAFEEIVDCAVNATRPTNEADRWGFTGFKLDSADPGLFRLALIFSKRCVL